MRRYRPQSLVRNCTTLATARFRRFARSEASSPTSVGNIPIVFALGRTTTGASSMRKFLFIAAAACLIAAPAAAGELRGAQATELASQGVYGDGPGVGLPVGPDRARGRDLRHWREREVRREGCRTVTVRETLPDGTRVKR